MITTEGIQPAANLAGYVIVSSHHRPFCLFISRRGARAAPWRHRGRLIIPTGRRPTIARFRSETNPRVKREKRNRTVLSVSDEILTPRVRRVRVARASLARIPL